MARRPRCGKTAPGRQLVSTNHFQPAGARHALPDRARLGITLPVGPFNGSCIVDPQLKPIERHLIPAGRPCSGSLEILDEFGVDIWLFTNDLWLTRNPDGEYVPPRNTRRDPGRSDHRKRISRPICRPPAKIVGASRRCCAACSVCEVEMQKALGTQATVVRSQNLLSSTSPPPGLRQGHLRAGDGPRASIFRPRPSPTIGDMQNDLAMFWGQRPSPSRWAMPTDDVQRKSRTHVTTTNEDEGFAGAIEMILKENAAS